MLKHMLNYAPNLDRAFQALADPGRRLMVERLSRGPASVSELGRPLDMSLAAVLQHVQTLEACGLIRTQKLGRIRTCSINAMALRSAESWIAERRTMIERRLDGLGQYLAETAGEPDTGWAVEPGTTSDEPGAAPDEPAEHGTTNQGGAVTDRSVIHDTFSIERTYPAPTSRVFAAFASKEAKDTWADTGDTESAEGSTSPAEFDFRPGGRERFGFEYDNRTYKYDARYYDIVPEQRIVYSYEMYADEARISVSVATIEFAKSGNGTTLTWTEQGAYLDGIDGAQAPSLRQEGTAEMLDGLAGYLAAVPAR